MDEYGLSKTTGLPAAGSKPGGYVPPNLKNRQAGEMDSYMKRREENSLRVTNLSEDTREDDLRVSFFCFGVCILYSVQLQNESVVKSLPEDAICNGE